MKPCVISGNLIEDVGRWGKFFEAKEELVSVLRVFGENLRLLCKTRPSIASVCRDLDINRVQFNRYMSSHSFPKPNVLQQICDYFLVDSRIYLEPLTPDDLERVRRGQSQSTLQAQPSYLHQAVDYFERGIALTVSQSELPDGIHCFWRRSFTELETASCNLISIKTVEGVRVFKSLELLKSQRNRAEISGRSTPSSRGVVMRCPDGYALFAINPHPSRFISLKYFENVYFSENLLSGFMVLARKEYFQRRRFSRCVLELLSQTSNCILNAARRTSRKLSMEDLPIMIKDVIETPL